MHTGLGHDKSGRGLYVDAVARLAFWPGAVWHLEQNVSTAAATDLLRCIRETAVPTLQLVELFISPIARVNVEHHDISGRPDSQIRMREEIYRLSECLQVCRCIQHAFLKIWQHHSGMFAGSFAVFLSASALPIGDRMQRQDCPASFDVLPGVIDQGLLFV
jgi:hypothetical protein